jgi:hypothetical protein
MIAREGRWFRTFDGLLHHHIGAKSYEHLASWPWSYFFAFEGIGGGRRTQVIRRHRVTIGQENCIGQVTARRKFQIIGLLKSNVFEARRILEIWNGSLASEISFCLLINDRISSCIATGTQSAVVSWYFSILLSMAIHTRSNSS